LRSVAFPDGIAKTLAGLKRPARDPWLRAAQSIPQNIAEKTVSEVAIDFAMCQ
jgi:hypothetical protein